MTRSLQKQSTTKRGATQKKVYYSHAMCTYGCSEEATALKTISRKFRRAEIVNPAVCEETCMEFYINLVETCDVLVFSKVLGFITSGVGKEINHSLRCRKSVFELRENQLLPVTAPVLYLSRARSLRVFSQWRAQREKISLLQKEF